jgi:hypothetical protein
MIYRVRLIRKNAEKDRQAILNFLLASKDMYHASTSKNR